ncbi:ppdK [Symbiodinium pilosum]|uniref:PpdK protein n=1 Tax=Symbiodinium pilosum TaxID=2952 RepID=A0A812ISX5_SYMPI|nr:ppdK [Symbiodinium pilosum]
MVWQLLPLHAPDEEIVPLPSDGDATLGRRPNNFLVCPHLAVSGTHCILHCNAGCPPEFEDCSTNGSFVNDKKLQKGQRCQLADGDIISLTKPLDAVDPKDGAEAGPRIQYKIVLHEEPKEDDPGDIPPTAPEPKRTAEVAVPQGENCFAQDLLVQEQQSKAKLTADLLVSQRKLDEERQSVENLSRELRKVRQQAEEERVRRQEAEEAKAKLGGEVEGLRAEARQLHELTIAHEELRSRHAASEKELAERSQRCDELEARQQQLREDLALAGEARQKSSQHLAELQIRARQAQERAERLRQQQSEAQREAERTAEESQRLQDELQELAAGREKLEAEVAASKSNVTKAEADERSARSKLDVATAKRAELECQAAAAQSDADSARISLKAAEQRAAKAAALLQHLGESGKGLFSELSRRLELWDKVLREGLPRAAKLLEEALAGDVAPTFAQATCREAQ